MAKKKTDVNSDEKEVTTTNETKVESKVETAKAVAESVKVAVTFKGRLVQVYNPVNYGDDYKTIAKDHADRIGGKVEAYNDPADPEPDMDVVDIVNQNGNLVRQFSLSMHGDDYKALAKAFVEKYGEKKGLRIKE